MASDPDLVLARLAAVFEHLRISYVIGGSLASSIYGIPRATNDADVLSEINESHTLEFVERMKGEFYIDLDMVRDAIQRKSSFSVIHLATFFKVDIFVAKPTSWARQEMLRSRRHQIGIGAENLTIPFSSPEDNILHKLDWYRLGGEISENQWNDVLGVLKVQKDLLDYDYLRKWAIDLGLLDLLNRAVHDSFSQH